VFAVVRERLAVSKKAKQISMWRDFISEAKLPGGEEKVSD
jgi:hypothetical protein